MGHPQKQPQLPADLLPEAQTWRPGLWVAESAARLQRGPEPRSDSAVLSSQSLGVEVGQYWQEIWNQRERPGMGRRRAQREEAGIRKESGEKGAQASV